MNNGEVNVTLHPDGSQQSLLVKEGKYFRWKKGHNETKLCEQNYDQNNKSKLYEKLHPSILILIVHHPSTIATKESFRDFASD